MHHPNIFKLLAVLLESMAKKSRRDVQRKVFLAVVVVIFLVSSIASIVLFRSDESGDSFSMTTKEGRASFSQMTDSRGTPYYQVSLNNRDFVTYFHPSALGLILDNQTKGLISSSTYFYMSIDPNSEDLSFMDFLRMDVKRNIPPSRFFIDAVSEETELYTLPVIDCSNSSAVPVIILKQTNSTSNSSFSGSCAEIEFSRVDSLRMRDALVYTLNGIEIN
jgi:hypothetical protein